MQLHPEPQANVGHGCLFGLAHVFWQGCSHPAASLEPQLWPELTVAEGAVEIHFCLSVTLLLFY